jgi:hypothetical protein
MVERISFEVLHKSFYGFFVTRNVKLANLSNNTCVNNSKLGTNVASKIPTNWNE